MLTESDVRELMQAYISVRNRRQRGNGSPGAPNGNGPSGADDFKVAGAHNS